MVKEKSIIFFCILLGVGCNFSSSDGEIVNKEIRIDSSEIKLDSNIIIPNSYIGSVDTTILNILKLREKKSLYEFISSNKIELVERIRPFPVATFLNSNREEYLLAYFYYGDSKYQFSAFEIGFYSKTLNDVKAIKTKYSNFETENGVKLNMMFDDLISIRGNQFESTLNDDGTLTVHYEIDDYDKNKFLQRFSMPSYFMNYEFEDSLLKKIYFGFEYP